MNRFDITYFHGPFPEYMENEDVIADIAESGMTLVPLDCDPERNRRVLPLLARFGLRADVKDPRITRVIREHDLAGAERAVREVVFDYRYFNNVAGYDLIDEPNAADFPVLAALVRAFRRYAPGKETVINLFPNYATPQQLGTVDYPAYLEEFVRQVQPDFISYDHYHFCGRQRQAGHEAGEVSERERMIRLAAERSEDRPGFFENLEQVRTVSLANGIPAMLIVLLTEHGPYRNLTQAELRFEVNQCLAYGFKRLSYFTYWEPVHSDHWQWANAMCDTKGNRMQHYRDAQEINATVADAGRWLFDKTSEAVFHVGKPEKGTVPFAGYRHLREVIGGEAVLGFFDDGSLYLTNRDFQNAASFTLRSDAPMALRIENYFADAGCELELTLGPGEAALLHF